MTEPSRPRVSDCGTFHINDQGEAIYESKFFDVLAFHDVNGRLLAPVQSSTHAWHIDKDGLAIYKQKFHRTFGYYCGYAAVRTHDEWYHIDSSGKELYAGRFAFAGNFQDDVAVVANNEGLYFHIDTHGIPLYTQRWLYCGDFRDGIAVVQAECGLSSHIFADGTFVHGRWFLDLDVFHKRHARAKDSLGWGHVDRQGKFLFTERYQSVEPFYNGMARCEKNNGSLVVINEEGVVIRTLRAAMTDDFIELSADMVGFWRTLTIATAVELKIFEHLPACTIALAEKCACNQARLSRLMGALHELHLVNKTVEGWAASDKGTYLAESHPLTLAHASVEYAGDLLNRWKNLSHLIRGKNIGDDIFKAVARDPSRVFSHHRMLASYALHDYTDILPLLSINPNDVVLDAAGGTGTLTQLLETHCPNATIVLGDLEEVVSQSDCADKIVMDLFKTWAIKADKIILSRVLHDWPNYKAHEIFKRATEALRPNGQIIVIEMLLETSNPSGALCDLHLLAVTGGQERTLEEISALASSQGLRLLKFQPASQLLSVISYIKDSEICDA